MRLVFVTQLIDPDDPVLGFVVRQIRALTREIEVVVIANEVRNAPEDLGAAVVSLGKEDGRRRGVRTLRYWAKLGALLRDRRTTALLAHMCPIYLTTAAPVTVAFRVPELLWFVHPADTATLRVAEALADRVLTAFPDSYPRPIRKLVPIGHAIDVDELGASPAVREIGTPLRVLALGRTSPVKRYDALVRGVAQARAGGVDVQLRIVGPSTTTQERAHRVELRALIRELALDGYATLEDGVPRERIPGVLAEADLLANLTMSGSADKVVFEAMASQRPAMVTSPAFAGLVGGLPLPLALPDVADDTVARSLATIAAAPPPLLADLGTQLRARVAAEHSLSHWATAVARSARDACAGRGDHLGSAS